MTSPPAEQAIRYEPDETCPAPVAAIVGVQGAVLGLTPLVLFVAITAVAGGQNQSYLEWSVFAALIISGCLTALQATRLWRFGAGHILIMGTTPNFVAISVLALTEGGPPLLASLTVAASLFYVALALWLPRIRKVLTPVVSGTVLMLLGVTILPVTFDRVREVPDGAADAAGPTLMLVTLAVTAAMALRASGRWRLWSPVIGIVAGCIVAVPLGAYDTGPVTDAPWAGLPSAGFPGMDLTPGVAFWTLLPAFVVVTLVGGIKNLGDCVAVQQASRRRPRVTDFRVVQGSLNTNGLGILFSGLAGTPPTTVYSATSVSLASLTGVASRRVGYAVGAALLALAFLPKMTAVLLTIPRPVMGAFVLVTLALIFVEGVRTVVQDGLDRQKAMVAGLAFAIGAGLDQQTIVTDMLGGSWGKLLDNGLLAGAIVAVVMTVFLNLTSGRGRQRLDIELDPAALPEIQEFLRTVASDAGWNDASALRLDAAAEETFISLLQGSESQADRGGSREAPRLIIGARSEGSMVELEFMAVFDDENLEDRLAYLSEEAEGAGGLGEGEISLRLLRHYASSVHHQKFHGLDIVTVQVRASG
jgi:NCS2 family nucleobase:cation symporter-2/xanthine permease XanP